MATFDWDRIWRLCYNSKRSRQLTESEFMILVAAQKAEPEKYSEFSRDAHETAIRDAFPWNK